MTKSRIEQIVEVRSRLRWPFVKVPFRMMDLRSEVAKAADLSPELLKYFPIATIACVETYFRRVIQELINAGPPRAPGFPLLTKLSFPVPHDTNGCPILRGFCEGWDSRLHP